MPFPILGLGAAVATVATVATAAIVAALSDDDNSSGEWSKSSDSDRDNHRANERKMQRELLQATLDDHLKERYQVIKKQLYLFLTPQQQQQQPLNLSVLFGVIPSHMSNRKEATTDPEPQWQLGNNKSEHNLTNHGRTTQIHQILKPLDETLNTNIADSVEEIAHHIEQIYGDNHGKWFVSNKLNHATLDILSIGDERTHIKNTIKMLKDKQFI